MTFGADSGMVTAGLRDNGAPAARARDNGAPAARAGDNGAPAARLRHVSAGYGGEPVVRSLSCTIEQGELLGIVGPSGAGKTTVLRLLTGQVAAREGTVEVLGRRVRAGRPPAALGYVPQVDSVDWDFPLRVEDAVLLGLATASARRPWFSRRERRHARAVLERLGLGGLERRHIRELSGGQQQRMFLARALVRDCRLLLLDEPTSGVDLATRAEILRLLGQLAGEGLAVVLTTHDLNWVAAHLPRVLCLAGEILADGAPQAVFTEQVLGRTYGADVRVLSHDGVLAVTDLAPLLDPIGLGRPELGGPGLRDSLKAVR